MGKKIIKEYGLLFIISLVLNIWSVAITDKHYPKKIDDGERFALFFGFLFLNMVNIYYTNKLKTIKEKKLAKIAMVVGLLLTLGIASIKSIEFVMLLIAGLILQGGIAGYIWYINGNEAEKEEKDSLVVEKSNENNSSIKPIEKKKNKKWLYVVFSLLLIIIAFLFNYYFFIQKNIGIINNKENVEPEIKTTKTKDYDMVYVEGGTFMMGSDEGEADEKPVHSVTVNNFYIGKYEVTQKEWVEVMGNNLRYFEGDNLPVTRVRWIDVQEFIKKLNQTTGKNYRLPTEAEWEYAARGGNKSKGYKYSGSNNINDVAWYISNLESKTQEVGTKIPNELGIYDMSGNVWEWCQDWYDKNYYRNSLSNNPKGPNSGDFRVLRGGSCLSVGNDCRSAVRGWYKPNDWIYNEFGFRLVKD